MDDGNLRNASLDELYEALDRVDNVEFPDLREKIEARIEELDSSYTPDGSIDKGYSFLHRKLSPRRKFIRALWVTLLFSIYVAYSLASRELNAIHMILMYVLLFALAYMLVKRYRNWKKDADT